MRYKSSLDHDWVEQDIIEHVVTSVGPGFVENEDSNLSGFIEDHDWELVRNFDPRSVWDPTKAGQWLESERRQSIKECGDDIWGHMLETPTDCPVVLLYSGDEFEEIVDGNHRMAAHAIMGWPIAAVIGRVKGFRTDLNP